jgi:RNA polymerase sigma-70 factor (ECF subfamily)
VAHNVAASHIDRRRRTTGRFVSIDELESEPAFVDGETQANQKYLLSRLFDQIYSLKPLDRQIILLYLEGETAAAISEVTGISASNVATKVHRLRKVISRASDEGITHDNG